MRRVFLCFFLMAWPVWAGEADISWDNMRNIKTHSVNGHDVIDFAAPLVALNGKTATVTGWITPVNLSDGTTVTSFLLTGSPGTCPFCFGFGPESFILVTAAEPVPADVTASLHMSGKFAISPGDPTGFYYRLFDAHMVDGQ